MSSTTNTNTNNNNNKSSRDKYFEYAKLFYQCRTELTNEFRNVVLQEYDLINPNISNVSNEDNISNITRDGIGNGNGTVGDVIANPAIDNDTNTNTSSPNDNVVVDGVINDNAVASATTNTTALPIPSRLLTPTWNGFDHMHIHTPQGQVNLQGETLQSIEELYHMATISQHLYQEMLSVMIQSTSLAEEQILNAPLKQMTRALEKAKDDYVLKEPGPCYAWLFDIVRASIICDTESQIIEVLEALKSMESIGLLTIIRFKNRFMNPTPGGFRDINMNIMINVPKEMSKESVSDASSKQERIRSMFTSIREMNGRRERQERQARDQPEVTQDVLMDSMQAVCIDDSSAVAPSVDGDAHEVESGSSAIHVCELQIHLARLKDKAKELHSHDVYSYFRTYFKGNQPAIDARLKLFSQIGFDDTAEMVQCSVESIVRDAIGDGTVDRLFYARQLLMLLGEYPSAVTLQRALIEALERAFGGSHSHYLSECQNLGGMLLFQINDYEEAKVWLDRAYNGCKEQFGDDHERTRSALLERGGLYYKMGRNAEACDIYRSIYEYQLRILGMDNRLTQLSGTNLATTLVRLDKFNEARELHSIIYAKRKETLGQYDADTLYSLNGLAIIEARTGNLQQAVVLGEGVVEGYERLYGPDNVDTVHALGLVATIYSELGNAAKAEELFKQVLAIQQGIFGKKHSHTIDTMRKLGTLWLESNRVTEAVTILEEAYEASVSMFGVDDANTQDIISVLSYAAEKSGDMVKAEKLARESLDSVIRMYGPDHTNTFSAYANLANTIVQPERIQESHDYFAKAEAGFAKVLGKNHLITNMVLEDANKLIIRLGRSDEALANYQHILSCRRAQLPPTSPKVLLTLWDLGCLHVDRKEYEEAKPYLEECYAGRASAQGEFHGGTLSVADKLIELYMAKLFDFRSLQTKLEHVVKASLHYFGDQSPETVKRQRLLRACNVAIANLEHHEASPFPESCLLSDHEHRLTLSLEGDGSRSCNVCNDSIIGACYACRPCDFDCCGNCARASM